MAAMATNPGFKVGDRVLFGRSSGEKTLGEVVKVNRSRLRVKQLDARGTYRSYPVGTVWAVPPSLCSMADGSALVPEISARAEAVVAGEPRSEQEIMIEIVRLYGNLSPENLHCDGEISRTAAARRGASFRRQLRECFQELGRSVSEDQAYAYADSMRGGR